MLYLFPYFLCQSPYFSLLNSKVIFNLVYIYVYTHIHSHSQQLLLTSSFLLYIYREVNKVMFCVLSGTLASKTLYSDCNYS